MSINLVAKCLFTVGCYESMPALRKIRPNTRHLDHTKFHQLRARTDALHFSAIQRFPKKWSDLPYHITDSLLCNSFSNFKFNLREHFKDVKQL